jgi:hypothetical protein
MCLVTPSHRVLIGRIEQMTKSRMKEGKIPTRREIGVKKVNLLLPKFQDQPYFTRAIEIMSPEWKEALSAMSSEEVAARFMALSFPEVFAEKERAEHKPATTRDERARDDRGSRGGNYERPDARHYGAPREKQKQNFSGATGKIVVKGPGPLPMPKAYPKRDHSPRGEIHRVESKPKAKPNPFETHPKVKKIWNRPLTKGKH